MDEEQHGLEIEEVQSEVQASLERARELLCEARLTLRQDQAADVRSVPD